MQPPDLKHIQTIKMFGSNAKEEPMKLVPHQHIGAHLPPTLPAPEQPNEDEVKMSDSQCSPPATATPASSPVASYAVLSAPAIPATLLPMSENMASIIAGEGPGGDYIAPPLSTSKEEKSTTISASITTVIEQPAGNPEDDGAEGPSMPFNDTITTTATAAGQASGPYHDDPVAQYTDNPRAEFPDYPTSGVPAPAPAPAPIPFTAMKVGDGGRNEVEGRDMRFMEEGVGSALRAREWRPAHVVERDYSMWEYGKLVGGVLGVCGTIGFVTAGTIYFL